MTLSGGDVVCTKFRSLESKGDGGVTKTWNEGKRQRDLGAKVSQFSRWVVSNSLLPHGLQHARLPVRHQLPEPTQTHVLLKHHVGDAIQPSRPLSSPSLPAFNFPSIRVFSNESVLHITWPNSWSFSFSISPSKEYSGLISFRMDWLNPSHCWIYIRQSEWAHQTQLIWGQMEPGLSPIVFNAK